MKGINGSRSQFLKVYTRVNAIIKSFNENEPEQISLTARLQHLFYSRDGCTLNVFWQGS